jgi:hypothetical protein
MLYEDNMQKSRNTIFSILLLVFSFTGAFSQEYFTDKGSVWTGGSLNFSSIGIKDGENRNNIIFLSPYVRFFPCKYFMLGPRIQWTGLFSRYASVNQFGIGLDLGFIYGKNEHIMPYLRAGGQFDAYGASYSGYSGDNEQGFSLPAGCGIVVKARSIFALQLESAIELKWAGGDKITVFSVSLGFAGVGKKIAVSALSGSGSVHY